ncbi:sensor histidine kinase [Microbispora sp. NPDC049125]|uniref:sensor histidine kinase n=1 Tax=Microbispora sp. NPDC049125 TaxID=3154929 RepID=UPI003464FC4C
MVSSSHLRACVGELDQFERGLQRSLDSLHNKLRKAIDEQRRFEADASHELRTPVAGLRARLEEAQLNPGEVDLDKLLERALGDVKRLQSIIDDLHLLSQVEAAGRPAGPVPVDLAEFVQAEVSRRDHKHEVTVKGERGVVVTAVPPRLGRLLGELLDNAQRHARSLVRVDVRRAGGLGELVVCDDGPGIPPHERERVFDRFARLDTARSRDRGGSGLGLAIVWKIAEAHGGDVHAEEAPGGGGVFVVRLPLARTAR